MTYLSTRKQNGIFGRKVSRLIMYWKAKRMYNEINRQMCCLEARFLKGRMNHA